MRLLIVTEKCDPPFEDRDGGAMLVSTLRRTFGESAEIMQFGPTQSATATWNHPYPIRCDNRFMRRLANADFVAKHVLAARGFTDVLCVHLSMQFGLADTGVPGARLWTFPMFLTPSYAASGEAVPPLYTEAERRALGASYRVLVPSYIERSQLIASYQVPADRIRVVPRGIYRRVMPPRTRVLDGPLRLCSIGSIKPQKNTLGLIRLFHSIRTRYPDSWLRVIGPAQDISYAARVNEEVAVLGLSDAVEFTGYVAPECLVDAVSSSHLHVSASLCETFGRAIFETLSMGLPNVARSSHNAAADFLNGAPYAQFNDSTPETLRAIDDLVSNLPHLSLMAQEIGALFDDAVAADLLAAEIAEAEPLVVADFDGTLLHKSDPIRTQRCVRAFQAYSRRVVCSAREVPDLTRAMAASGVSADWIIGCGGSAIADGQGRALWHRPLSTHEMSFITDRLPLARPIVWNDAVLQMTVPSTELPPLPGFRVEQYQDTMFIGPWECSKLRTVHRLMRQLSWKGRVRAFGDGRYDSEMLAFFDGTRIVPNATDATCRQAEELGDDIH